MSGSKGLNPVRFATEVRQEARKVTWTSWRETVITTIMVLIMVMLAAGFFYAVDTLIQLAVRVGFSFGS